MYTSLILVYLAVALTFSSCTAHRGRWWNSPRRPEIGLRSLHCDKVEKFDLCRCCPVDPCDSVECLNGGNCVGGICECVSGYSGPTCNIDPCDSVECLNGGQCVGEGFCNCTFGFGGTTCNMRVCNVTECTERNNGQCIILRCETNATNCAGIACNTTNDEVCIDDTCVDRSNNCATTIDGILNFCAFIGEPCGEGTFCDKSTTCVNDTCRSVGACNEQNDDTSCASITFGSCSGGVCLEPCSDESECNGGPCIGGFCAVVYCGESYCFLRTSD